MKTKTLIICLLLMLITVVSFSGCTKKDANTLRMATNAEFPPWENVVDGKVVGFDIDLGTLIAEKLGMTLKVDNMKFESVVASVAAGTCDIAIAGLTINETRSKSVDFSELYYEASQILIVKIDDDQFTGTTKAELDEQLKNKKIGVCQGFTGAAYAEGDEDWEFEGVEGATIKTYDNVSLAAEDLKNGTIEVIIMDDSVAKRVVAADNFKDILKTIDVALTTEAYAIAIKKGNTELKAKIDKAINELKEEGILDEYFDKWEIVH